MSDNTIRSPNVAVTLTGVGRAPELTTATALPAASVVAEAESSATPPRSVDSVKLTVCHGNATPVLSVTLKVTSACSDKPVPPPDPFRATVSGEALTKTILLGGATVGPLENM